MSKFTVLVRLVCSLLVIPMTLLAQNLEIHVINVGWGASIFVKGPNGTTILMEAGNTGDGTNEVVPYLQSIGHNPSAGFDYTIAGHQHCDHIGGLDEVINAGYDVRIENYYNGSSNTSTCVDGWNAAAATTTAGAPISMPVGTEILLGNGAKLTCVARNGSIIGGGSVSVSDENDRSIAVLIQYGGFDFLWGSDMGGGDADNSCTGRSTTQVNVETAVINAISPGGASPLISDQGIDVLYCNHHGSESSTNPDWMNKSKPTVAIISVGAGQSSGWDLPRIDVVEHVLLAEATACITVPAADVFQSEEGSPTGSLTSFAGYCVGDITITTDGVSTFTVNANGAVNQGPNELAASGLPKTYNLDDASGPPDTTPPIISNVQASNITTNSALITWTTDEVSNSVVEYGLTTSYGSTSSDAAMVTSHSITLTGLSSSTLYHYRVQSTDGSNNTATSGDFTFTTATPIAPIETFADGNFTSNPAWGGNTSAWQVVTSSDVAAGATNSNTLRLNYTSASSGTRYLRTQRTASWGTSQSWSFWMGRRAQAATNANHSIMWLWANNSNLTSSSVDGYRVRFGDDSGGDNIVLQVVTNNSATDIITSSGTVPNGLTDIGLMVRVTRTSGSVWTLYTSTLPTTSGSGAVATDQPSAANTTVNQGSVTNSTYTNFTNGYFGFMAVHSSGSSARTAAEFDQLYFDTSSTSPLGKPVFEQLVTEVTPTLPQAFHLYQNYPNPFNPTTRIRYDLKNDARVSLTVYDVLGREVAQLVSDERKAGIHTALFDGTYSPSGVYYYRLIATPLTGERSSFVEIGKMMLVK
ncbi:MAG: fibronectin type III domain-containing protein [Ignavibacteriae bacterium]|nr:fibronectin type III domain-containing protein [Ignavibacteriota bacterium]